MPTQRADEPLARRLEFSEHRFAGKMASEILSELRCACVSERVILRRRLRGEAVPMVSAIMPVRRDERNVRKARRASSS